MSKRQSVERAARKSKAMLGQHVKELLAHRLEVSRYGGHGHAEGRQGRAGHPMPKSDAQRQSHAHIPQNMDDRFGADDPAQNDYGIVDKATSLTSETARHQFRFAQISLRASAS
jgi:hypothetical protein